MHAEKKRGICNASKACALLVVLAIAFLSPGIVSAASALEVNTVLLKVGVQQGDSIERSVSITSKSSTSIETEVRNVAGVRVLTPSLSLQKGETKELKVLFDAARLSPGVSVGNLVIRSNGDETTVPLIFEVGSKDTFFAPSLEVPPQYAEVTPGTKFITQLTVFDVTSDGGRQTGLGATPITLTSQILDFAGNVISSDREQMVVDRKAQLTKSLSLPKEMKPGQYVITAMVNYRSSVAVTSRVFRVVVEPEEKEQSIFLSLPFLFTVIVIVVILIIYFMVRDRDRLIVELEKYNALELKRQKELLMAQARLLQQRKKANLRSLQKEVDHHLKRLQKKQRKRVHEMHALKERGDTTAMQKKLEEWKKQGYHVSASEYKLRNLSAQEMQQLMEEWKKKSS